MDKQKSVKKCLNCKNEYLKRYAHCPKCQSGNCKVIDASEDDYKYIFEQDIIRRIVNS